MSELLFGKKYTNLESSSRDSPQSARSASPAPLRPIVASITIPLTTNEVAAVDRKSAHFSVTLRYLSQHTVAWDVAVTATSHEAEVLPPGECNLYAFPAVMEAGKSATEKLTGSKLKVLCNLITGLALAPAPDAMDVLRIPDSSGACMLHALCMSNDDDGCNVALQIMEKRPDIIPEAHHCGRYFGENALHVFAVNRRQPEMLKMLSLGEQHLDDEALAKLCNTLAEGDFFRLAPMRSYGGSPMGYACAFHCIKVLSFVLASERLNRVANLSSNPCVISGYLPIHVAAANGRHTVFDFLIAHGVDAEARTLPARESTELSGLSALQLACRLGNKRMTEHILTSRWQVEWRWGPVTQYRLPLSEIDSSNAVSSAHDVMELLCLSDALPATREMLLDEFMGGFIYTLFQEKWDRFARRQHWIFRLIDIFSLALLLSIGLSLKAWPLEANRRELPALGLFASAGQLLYETAKAVLWVRAKDAVPNKLLRKVVKHALSVIACASIPMATHLPSEDGAGDEISWGLVAIAVFSEFSHFISVIFVPYKDYGIFSLVVERLLETDVKVFLVFFFLYLSCFWTTMYIIYPRAGTGSLDVIPQFNSMRDSFEAMLNLGIAGIHFDIDFSSDAVIALEDEDVLHRHKLVDLVIFAYFYYYCMLLLVILLLRMLMAMLTATFAAVKAAAVLQFRLQFARHVLELELVAEMLGFHVFCGYNDADEGGFDEDEAEDRSSWQEIAHTSRSTISRDSYYEPEQSVHFEPSSLRRELSTLRGRSVARPMEHTRFSMGPLHAAGRSHSRRDFDSQGSLRSHSSGKPAGQFVQIK